MNRHQRATAGIKGSIENAADDIRHEYERAVYGRKTTGDINMFPAENGQEQAEPEQDNSAGIEKPEIGIDQDEDGMDID